jgi:hypothetical protein
MASDMDFNGADAQDAAFDLIPANTLVKVTMIIRPGGAGPEGWLTQSQASAAQYLNTEAIVMEGPYARRRIYTRIGFRGKGVDASGVDKYANRGRALIRGILESARGIKANDQSEAARAARLIRSLGDLNSLDEPDEPGRNVIKAAVGPEHRQYAEIMGGQPAPIHSPSTAPQGYIGRVVQDPYAGSDTASDGGAPFWAR